MHEKKLMKDWPFALLFEGKRHFSFLSPSFGKLLFYFLIGLPFLAYLLPFLYAFAFCWPRGDDFDGISRSMFLFDLLGGFYEIAREWLTWSGRYTYHFLAVFLGKAAANPFSYGLLCLSVSSLYVWAFFFMGKLAGLKKSAAFYFSLASMCVLFAFYGKLADFYLLTDALTIVLQFALYLLFLKQLLHCWIAVSAKEIKHSCKLAIVWGILAIGVYEHAALAVFWTLLSFLLLMRLQAAPELGSRVKQIQAAFKSLTYWLAPALLFSFLAPGNLSRKSARQVDWEQQVSQLSALFPEWLTFLKNFLFSPWPVASICLIALLRTSVPSSHNSPRKNLSLCLIFFSTFILFSLSIAALHALSDVPLGSADKLSASLELYAALCLGLICFFMPFPLDWLKKPFFSVFYILILYILFSQSANFQKTVINAANGQLLLYGNFMKERELWLKKISVSSDFKQDKFGLIGEILNPEVRKRHVRPEGGEAVVQAFPKPVFPVNVGPYLAQDPEGWPNLWAAWVYGLGSLSEREPDSSAAFEALKEDLAIELKVPTDLLAGGLERLWYYADYNNPNPSFRDAWLIFSASKAITLSIILPSLPEEGRLLPMLLQRKIYGALRERATYEWKAWLALFSIRLVAKLQETGKINALCLKPCLNSQALPNYLFASIDGLIYHRLLLTEKINY